MKQGIETSLESSITRGCQARLIKSQSLPVLFCVAERYQNLGTENGVFLAHAVYMRAVAPYFMAWQLESGGFRNEEPAREARRDVSAAMT